MALDKLVDSAQLGADLEDVADAIRAKSGGSSPLAFPAGFVSEIGNIPSGGGLPSDITGIAAGTYTLASNATSHTFTHNLGCYPTVFYVGIMQNQDLSIEYFLFAATVGYSSTGGIVCNIREQTTNVTGTPNMNNNKITITNNSITITRSKTAHGQFLAGITYFWVAVKTASSYVNPE